MSALKCKNQKLFLSCVCPQLGFYDLDIKEKGEKKKLPYMSPLSSLFLPSPLLFLKMHKLCMHSYMSEYLFIILCYEFLTCTFSPNDIVSTGVVLCVNTVEFKR